MTTVNWPLKGTRYSKHHFSVEIQADIRALNRSDNWHSLFFFAIDIAWIAGCVVACHKVTWWLYPIAAFIIGARQRAFSTIFHDCIHGIGATNRALNIFIGTVLTAYPIFQLHYAYKLSHVFGHHPRLGDPERDPDLKYFIKEEIYTPIAARRYFNRVVLLPIVGARTVSFIRYLISTRFKFQSSGKDTSIEYPQAQISKTQRVLDKIGFWGFWATVGLVAWRTGTVSDVLLFWMLPYLTTFQLLSWYIELGEHTPLMRDNYVDIYMTRNRKSRGLEKFLTAIHNDNYHWDHHLDQRTPCWSLPAAHAIRMRDATFAKLDREMGGLLTKGPEGQPSVMTVIVNTLAIPEEPAGETQSS